MSATALAAKELADEGERADMFAAAHCQAIAAAEPQLQEDKAACREKGSALRAPAPVRAQATADRQERGSALRAPAPAWAKTEAGHPRTPAEAAGYDEAKCASVSNCQAEAKADRQTQAVLAEQQRAQAILAEQQRQADKATCTCAVANKAQQEVKGAKCNQRAWVLAPSKPSQALSGTDLVPDNTMMSLTNSPTAEPSPATRPPQDEVSVYTVAFKTNSLKPYLATTTPTAGGTCSYLAAVAPATGLRAPAPAFTPVGATLGNKRSGADGQA
jgi:hypothetical protein